MVEQEEEEMVVDVMEIRVYNIYYIESLHNKYHLLIVRTLFLQIAIQNTFDLYNMWIHIPWGEEEMEEGMDLHI